MITLDLNPKTKIYLPSRLLNWVVGPAPQTYTYEEINGDLTEDLSAASANNKIESDPVPNIAAEDFESVYCWFIA